MVLSHVTGGEAIVADPGLPEAVVFVVAWRQVIKGVVDEEKFLVEWKVDHLEYDQSVRGLAISVAGSDVERVKPWIV